MTSRRPLPDGWRWAALGDVCRVFTGGPAPQGSQYFDAAGPFFFRVSDISAGGSRTPNLSASRDKLSALALETRSLVHARAGTVVFPKSGAAIATNNRAMLGVDGYLVSHLMALEAHEETVLPSWLYYATCQLDMMDYSGNAGYPSLRKSTVGEIEIPLPSIKEQHHIVSDLEARMEAAERARRAAEAQLAAMLAMPAALLREAFRADRYSESMTSQRPLPEGWRWAALGEVCEINPRRPRNLPATPDELVTFIPMSAVDEGAGAVTQPQERPLAEVTRGYTYMEDGDVIFAKITPCMQNGKHAIVGDTLTGFAFGSTEFHVLRPGDAIHPVWVHRFLLQPSVLYEAEQHFTGTAGQRRVPKQYLIEKHIPLPSLAEQRRIVADLEARMAAAERARRAAGAQLATAAVLPSAILRSAFAREAA